MTMFDLDPLPVADGATFTARQPQTLEPLAYDSAEDLHILTDETGAVFVCDDDTSFEPVLDAETPGVLPLGLLIEQRAAARFAEVEAQIAALAARLTAAEGLIFAQAVEDNAADALYQAAGTDRANAAYHAHRRAVVERHRLQRDYEAAAGPAVIFTD